MKKPEVVKYLAAVRRAEKHFIGFSLKHIPRIENAEADELAKAAAQGLPLPIDVFYQVLSIKAIKAEEGHPSVIHSITNEDWRTPIFVFLQGTYEPSRKHDLDKMVNGIKYYRIIVGDLYKQGMLAPMLKCISQEQGK